MKAVRLLFWISLTIVGLIGLVHTLFTFMAFDHLSQRALYFAGTGLGVLVLVLFNLAAWHGTNPDRFARRLSHVANGIMVIYGCLAIRAVPEPQAYVGFAAFVCLCIAVILLDRRVERNQVP